MKKNLFYTLLFFAVSTLAMVARAKMGCPRPEINKNRVDHDRQEFGAACNFPLSYFNDNI